MVKVKLLTPRVTIDTSHAAGDVIEVESDEATRMIDSELAVAVEKNKPTKPKLDKSKKA